MRTHLSVSEHGGHVGFPAKRTRILSIPSKPHPESAFLPFCSFCYREQNERNDEYYHDEYYDEY